MFRGLRNPEKEYNKKGRKSKLVWRGKTTMKIRDEGKS